jgi:hypothetical protein
LLQNRNIFIAIGWLEFYFSLLANFIEILTSENLGYWLYGLVHFARLFMRLAGAFEIRAILQR